VTSPATGAETEVAKAKQSGREQGKEARPSEAVEVHLEHARWRHFGWMMFGLVAGVLLVWIFGIVAKVLGLVFLLIAAIAGYGFVRTLLHPPGRIVVGDGKVTLPAGLCRGVEHRYDLDQVRHAFFLRRAVPWTRASPVLVIEVGERAFSYPRDWFVSERNQRRVAEAINGHLGRGADA
jgi:hypothetical protein